MCYGHLPNANLLLNYGFAVENNRFDRLQISSSMRSPFEKDARFTDKGPKPAAGGCLKY